MSRTAVSPSWMVTSTRASDHWITVLDGTCIQLEYFLTNFCLQTVELWNDFTYFTLPIGLDHGCAHSISRFQWSRRPRIRGKQLWIPTVCRQSFTQIHYIIRMNEVGGQHNSLEGLERSLGDAGQQRGNCENTYLRLQPSNCVKSL